MYDNETLTALVGAVSSADRVRIKEARRFAHRASCPTGHLDERCVACPTNAGTLLALRHLDEHPRDAKGARLLLHDAVCTSCLPGGDGREHADRTQARAAAALRKFRAQESA